MVITVCISSVDNETFLTLVTPHAQHALKFLAREDHEGSCVCVKFDCGVDDGYRLLRTLKDSDAR